MRIVVVPDRRLHRDRLLRDLHDLEDLVLGHVHEFSETAAVGFDPGLLEFLARDAVHAVDRFDHVHRDADRAGLVRDRARDRLADPPGRVGRELVAAAVFELVDRLHEADVPFLDEVEELQAPVRVLLRDRDDETQIRLGHFALGVPGLRFAGRHLLVGVQKLVYRHEGRLFELGQLMLLFGDGRAAAQNLRALFGEGGGDFVQPRDVGRMVDEAFHEPGAVDAGASDELVVDDALGGAQAPDRHAERLAETVRGLRGEAKPHQILLDAVLQGFLIRLHGVEPGVALLACLTEALTEILELRVHAVEHFERAALQLLQLPHRHRGGAHVGFVVGADHRAHVVRRRDAVDHVVDRHRAFADRGGALQNLFDRHRAARDGEHHVLQAVLDALRDFDFTFSGKQLDGTHLAHVDAHGVGRAAEFAVDGRERGFGLGFRVLFRDGGAGALHQELLFVGRDLMDLDVEVREDAHDRLDRIVVDEAVRDVVVDFAVGDVAALLAHADELQELGPAVLLAFLFDAVAVRDRVAERLFAGALRATRALRGRGLAGGFRGFGGFLRVVHDLVDGLVREDVVQILIRFVVDHVGEVEVVPLEPVEVVVFVGLALLRGLLRRLRLLGGLGRFFSLLGLLCLRLLLGGLGVLFGLFSRRGFGGGFRDGLGRSLAAAARLLRGGFGLRGILDFSGNFRLDGLLRAALLRGGRFRDFGDHDLRFGRHGHVRGFLLRGLLRLGGLLDFFGLFGFFSLRRLRRLPGALLGRRFDRLDREGQIRRLKRRRCGLPAGARLRRAHVATNRGVRGRRLLRICHKEPSHVRAAHV